jgi:hypothetical protein
MTKIPNQNNIESYCIHEFNQSIHASKEWYDIQCTYCSKRYSSTDPIGRKFYETLLSHNSINKAKIAHLINPNYLKNDKHLVSTCNNIFNDSIDYFIRKNPHSGYVKRLDKRNIYSDF